MNKTGNTTGNADEWDKLIGELYEAVLEPGRLVQVLRGFDSFLGSRLCHLMGWNNRSGTLSMSAMSNPEFHEAGRAYAEYYGQIDPRRRFAESQSVGGIWACHDHFNKKYVSGNEFYQDFLIPSGARYVLGGYVHETADLKVFIVFNHLVGQDEFDSTQRLAIRRLMPHLQRVMRMTLSVETLRAGSHAGELGLTALGQAVFTLDGMGHIAFANEVAETMLRDSGVLHAQSQRLAGKGNNASKFASAADRTRLTRQSESVLLEDTQNPSSAWLVSILPIPRVINLPGIVSHEGTASASLGMSNVNRAWMNDDVDLVVLAVPQHAGTGAMTRTLAKLFKLTDAEARLAHGLSAGKSVEEYASKNGISVTTARTQIRSILAKTGERRQHDLVGMLARLPRSKT
jgi:DNA-binding CsgD family transcriptional regulator